MPDRFGGVPVEDSNTDRFGGIAVEDEPTVPTPPGKAPVPQPQQLIDHPTFGSRFYENTLKPIADIYHDYAAHTAEHSPTFGPLAGFPALAQTAGDVFGGIGQGMTNGAIKTYHALKSGDYGKAMEQSPGMVPLIGPAAVRVGEDAGNGDYSAALGGTAGLFTSGLAPKIAKINLGDAGSALSGAAGGAVDSFKPISYEMHHLPIPAPVVGAMAGRYTGQVGGPIVAKIGAGIGFAAPIVKGAWNGARAALAAREPAPISTDIPSNYDPHFGEENPYAGKPPSARFEPGQYDVPKPAPPKPTPSGGASKNLPPDHPLANVGPSPLITRPIARIQAEPPATQPKPFNEQTYQEMVGTAPRAKTITTEPEAQPEPAPKSNLASNQKQLERFAKQKEARIQVEPEPQATPTPTPQPVKAQPVPPRNPAQKPTGDFSSPDLPQGLGPELTGPRTMPFTTTPYGAGEGVIGRIPTPKSVGVDEPDFNSEPGNSNHAHAFNKNFKAYNLADYFGKQRNAGSEQGDFTAPPVFKMPEVMTPELAKATRANAISEGIPAAKTGYRPPTNDPGFLEPLTKKLYDAHQAQINDGGFSSSKVPESMSELEAKAKPVDLFPQAKPAQVNGTPQARIQPESGRTATQSDSSRGTATNQTAPEKPEPTPERNPGGTWSIGGKLSIPGELLFRRKDGSAITQEDLNNAKLVGPGILGLQPRTFSTMEEAQAAIDGWNSKSAKQSYDAGKTVAQARPAEKVQPSPTSPGDGGGYYVSQIRDGKYRKLAGPFDTKTEAEAQVEPMRRKASDADPFSDFDSFGVMRDKSPALPR